MPEVLFSKIKYYTDSTKNSETNNQLTILLYNYAIRDHIDTIFRTKDINIPFKFGNNIFQILGFLDLNV